MGAGTEGLQDTARVLPYKAEGESIIIQLAVTRCRASKAQLHGRRGHGADGH